MKKFSVSVPVTSKPIRASTLLPLAVLIELRNKTKDEELRKVIQQVIGKQTGGVEYIDVELEIQLHNFPLKPILEQLGELRKGI